MSFVRRLYRGETRIEFVGNRERWYFASLLMILICIASLGIRGFHYSVEFSGGTEFQIPARGSSITTTDVANAFSGSGANSPSAPIIVGSGSTRQIVVTTGSLTPSQLSGVETKLADDLHIVQGSITTTSVSSSWGHEITVQAIEALIIFIILVSIYISIRFEWRMAVGGIIALLHDLLIAAGIYSLVGWEVSPSTVVGLLTILGFSLYDTVVVYDKVAENAKGLLDGARMTYSEAANLAVNQTLMRSINTSLIALLPVAGLLFIGAGVLGVGTIKDLGLILFVGLASGAYSSLFLATPIVVDLTEAQPAYKALTKRVAAKRAQEAARAVAQPAATVPSTRAGDGAVTTPSGAQPRRGSGPAPAPRPGARPNRSRRR